MKCRSFCGACCIAPSITSKIPNMPEGKAAGVPCIHLDENFSCAIFHSLDRPLFCTSLLPSISMCGNSREEALEYLRKLEEETKP